MAENTGSRVNILAALEEILGSASDKHIEELNRALIEHNDRFPPRGHQRPVFMIELLDTLESECGYRYCRENAEAICIKIDDITSQKFTTALAVLQDALGVNDGGFAVIYFRTAGMVERWRRATPAVRNDVIREYSKQQSEIG